MSSSQELFEEICSKDFLNFQFDGKKYQDQLYDSIAKTKALSAVKVELKKLQGFNGQFDVVWVTHNFEFLGGSLGCAEGEKITKAFEYALEHRLGVCVQCRTGGARMQEGTSSLMQMAKVSVAVEALHKESLPFISVLNDPTYGGVSASYAMQADVRIAVSDARIGFAGPQVILNTMCEADQQKYDLECPADFQSASYVSNYGQLDLVLNDETGATQADIERVVSNIFQLLLQKNSTENLICKNFVPPTENDLNAPFNYTNSRKINRPQALDIINELFHNYIELIGDGKVGKDSCIRGGLAFLQDSSHLPCIVLGTFKGHTPQAMQNANYGMASPHGYRTALKLMKLAERFNIPVVSMVDTVGAWPTFACERDGQSEAIATNLTVMAGLTVPIVTLVIGEGGSGGALGIGMGNVVGMLSGGYYGVISPEGAASILGRYKDDAHKAKQFPLDCQELAVAQCIYANQLKSIGVVDEIIWEHNDSENEETYKNFPVLRSRIQQFIFSSLNQLRSLNKEQLISQRYQKYRSLGSFLELSTPEQRLEAIAIAEKNATKKAGRGEKTSTAPSKLISHLAELTVSGSSSRYRDKAPKVCPLVPPKAPAVSPAESIENAKSVLDSRGPQALANWVREYKKTLITDTTMRDAHQSLLATRVRTEDLVKICPTASSLLAKAFSLEVWGGATFDVSMRFLDECPWDRLREIRKACPNICLQMLLRGSNAVGYTSYPDNVVAEFVRLAALNGIDIFRIFDCFNDVESMKVSIDAVIKANKVAEVCICYTGKCLTSKIYNVDYYQSVAREIVAAGAHMIGIKDMAGLLLPQECKPLLDAIRAVIPADMPIHFHTHSTSSGSIATCLEMARLGCDIIDVCTASMADGTSQCSMNAFVAMVAGTSYETDFQFLDLEPYDMYWAKVRDMYSEFESGMKSGSARVYEHQIPGGQYSNLIVQCQSMGLWDRWEEVLDAYRDANEVLGDVIKVTPSSKCVGDLALYLVTRNLKAADLIDANKSASIDFPDSVVGLLKGDLGFPHKGFPEAVEKAVLKGAPKRTIRAGLTMPPADLEANVNKLSEKWGREITPEQAMSSLMYPKVFDDYMKSLKEKGGRLLRYLPTPVYLHGLIPNQEFVMLVPQGALEIGSANLVFFPEYKFESADELVEVKIKLERVGPLKGGARDVFFLVNGNKQIAKVKDSAGAFVYTGPMADASNAKHISSPMPGAIEKLLVADGQKVSTGDVLCTISAMKMEVKVTAPVDAVIKTVHLPLGSKVVEGALLIELQ